MKKVSNILWLVGSIISIIIAVSMVLMAVSFFAISSSTEAIKEFLKENIDKEFDYDPYLKIARIGLIVSGICCAVVALLNIILSIFANQGRQPSAKHADFIINIVLGVFAGNSICIAGGVLGLVAESKKDKKAPAEQSAEAEEVEAEVIE